MPQLYRHLSLVALLALLLAAGSAARPAHAQAGIQVTNLTDLDNGGSDDCGGDGCSLREAIRLANSRVGPNTITFSVAGEIVPTLPLPELTDDGTTINGGPAHTVVLNGASAGEANGLTIRSSNNTIRGLVIYNFTNTNNDFAAGAGIYINGAAVGGGPAGGDNNQLYDNWIGINGAGSAAISNAGYGVFLTNGASGNIIGANADGERNVISGSLAGGVILLNNTTLAGLLDGNRIVGNYIGVTPAGDALPAGLNIDQAEAGVIVRSGSRNTEISNNLIGGFNSPVAGVPGAGVYVSGHDAGSPTSDQIPTNTTITGNYIGVSRGGVRLANRIGVQIGSFGRYGPDNTTVGGADAAARNVIAGNGFRGIELPDTGFMWGDATIAGNYIGLDGAGARQPNGWSSESLSGPGIYIGLKIGSEARPPGRITVGPGNVISANVSYGIWARTGGHVIKGNLFGTNLQGSSSTLATTANGSANIFLENGAGVLIGGPAPADRNIIAFSGLLAGGVAGGILINPRAAAANNCGGPCVSGGHTVEGNYIGVAADGSRALNTATGASGPEARTKEGIRLASTSDNVIRNNLIGGLDQGITLGLGTAGTEANNTLIVGNKIGAPASGEIFFATRPAANQISAPRNLREGIKIFNGSGNTIRANLVAYNSVESDSIEPYGGIRVGSVSTAASNNVVEDNRVVRNGESNAWGIVVDTSDNVRLSRNTTQFNAGEFGGSDRGGILLSRGGNNSIAAPTGLAIVAGTPPSLSGSAAGCSGCTVEVFGSSLASEVNEGPVYLTSGTTQADGSFSIRLDACLRYLTTTVTDGAGNTSRFSSQLDAGAACTPLSFSLGAASNPSRNVAPGDTTVYTHTISNNSLVSLNFTVVFTSSQGWASAPALVTVGPNSSADFAVSVRVPPGTSAGGPVDTTDVQVFAGFQGSNVVRDTTTPQVVTLNPAQPAISGPLTQQRAGATVTFSHVVTNTGDVAGTFVLAGTPTLSGAPGDWSVGPVTPSSLTLGPQLTGTLDIVVNTPSLASPTAPVTLSFQLNVQGSSPLRFATQSDFIITPVARSFSFAPRSSETITTPAGASVSFTYTLTNTGNAADSFSVSAAPPTPVVAPPLTASVASSPPLASLAPGASAAVTVTYSVPSGTTAGAYSSTITAEATGGASPPAPQTRSVTINVTGGAAVAILPGPPSVNPVVPVGAGTPVSFTNTLTNTGNAAGPVEIGEVTGAPASWTVNPISTTCPISPAPLAAGATCTFIVEVGVPVGSPGGPIPLGISATIFNSPPDIPDVTATAVNTVNVAIVRGLELAPDGLSATAGPGQPVTFTHTLTNTGNAPDSFDLAVVSSDNRWTVSVSPTVVSDLPAGAPRTVEVTAAPGAGLTGGMTSTLTLTATGQGGGPSASVSDTVALASILGGDLSPGGRRNVDAGGTVPFTFTVANTGTVPLSYTVDLQNSLAGWTAQAGGVPTAVVTPGLTTTLTVSVTAPLDAAPGVTNTTTVQLLAGDGSGAPLDSSTAVTGIGPRLGALLNPESVTGAARPNSTVVLTHTLTNIGSELGTFRLTVVESLGWAVEVSPDLISLAPGASVPVLVRVSVKPSAEAGAHNFVKVRAELLGDATIFDESVDEVDVPLVAGLSLSSSQLRGVRPGTTTSLDSLTLFNSGSAFDFFSLSISGEDADWDVILGQSVVAVNTGDPARVSVQVRVGAGVAPGTQRTIRVEARSNTDGSVRASVDLILIAVGEEPPPPPPPPPLLPRVYLPVVQR